MNEPSHPPNQDVVEALDTLLPVSFRNCYTADARRSSMNPQEFTATYNLAKDFVREAGKSSRITTIPNIVMVAYDSRGECRGHYDIE